MSQKPCCLEHTREIFVDGCVRNDLRLVGFLDVETLKIRASDLKSQGGILACSLILLLEMASFSPWVLNDQMG